MHIGPYWHDMEGPALRLLQMDLDGFPWQINQSYHVEETINTGVCVEHSVGFL
jgi:hypothetical protein